MSPGYSYFLTGIVMWLGTGLHIWFRGQGKALQESPLSWLPLKDVFIYSSMIAMAVALLLVGTSVILSPTPWRG